MAAVAAALLAGVELTRLDRIQTCSNPRRLYLCRSQLLPNPRLNTLLVWQILYESQSDHTFITTMGLDVQTFGFI